MTPDAAVSRLAELVAARPGLTEGETLDVLEAEGMPPDLANRAYKFALYAWGRVLLEGSGVRSSPDYICFDADGRVAESGRIADEPCYAAAARLAPRCAGGPGFAEFAVQSSEVHALNDALRSGSRPEDLVSAPAATFLEPPTEEGFARARRHLASLIDVPPPLVEQAIARRPFWRFWSQRANG